MTRWTVWNILGAVLVLGIYLEVIRVIELARRMRRVAEQRALLVYLHKCGYGQYDEQDDENDDNEKPQASTQPEQDARTK